MADEKRQLILDLLARNKMGKDTEAAAHDIDKLAGAADQASKKTDKLNKSEKQAQDQIGKFGRSTNDTKAKIAGLNTEIESVQGELVGLAESFQRTGDSGERLDISKAIRRTENDLRRLNKSKGILEDILPDPAPEVKKWTQKLGDSVVGDLAASSPLATGGVVIGTILAPEIGALVSAAIVGGVGLGGIIGGIALAASSDAQIKAYAGRIGKTFVSGIQAEARDAFSGPINDSLGKVEALAERSVPKLGAIFTNLAPSLAGLTDNLVRAGDVLLTSFVGASEKAGPVLKSLGGIIEDTSTTLAGFIDIAANHSDQAASGLDDLNGALQDMLKVTALAVGGLTDVKGALDVFDSKIDATRYKLEDHVSWLDLTADGYKKGSVAAQMYRDGLIGAAGSANDYDHYLAGAAESTNNLKAAQDNEAKAALGQRDAIAAVSKELRAQVDPAFAVLNAQDKVRGAQDSLTEATKKYGSRSTEARTAARNLADATLDLQGAAGGLTSAFDGKLSPSMLNTLKAAKLTKPQIAAIEAELKRAKAAADAYAGRYVAEIITNYTYNVGGADYNREANRGNLGKRAAGGPVTRGVPYIVGEQGPEIMVPDASGRVVNASASRGVMVRGMASGNTMTDTVPRAIRMEVVGNDQRLVSLLKYLIRTANVIE